MLAAELETTVNALVRKLGPDQILLDDIGMRCCTRTTAHAVIAEQAARQDRQREIDAANAAVTAEAAERAKVEMAALTAGGPIEYELDDGRAEAPSGYALADLMRRDR